MLIDNQLQPLSVVGVAYVDIGVHLTSDWLMGAAVLSNILMQNTWILEKFAQLHFYL